jgi:hypothetical protein
MAPTQLSQTTLAILAGGGGTRMGRAKGLLEIRGKPILEYLLERFDWPGLRRHLPRRPRCLDLRLRRTSPPPRLRSLSFFPFNF